MNTQSNQSNNEIKMLHEVIADYKLQNEKLVEENKELKAYKTFVKSKCKNEVKEELPEHALIIERLNEEFSVAQDRIMELEEKLYVKHTLEKENCKCLEYAFEDLLIEYIKNYNPFIDDGIELDGGKFMPGPFGNKVYYTKQVQKILNTMNEEDWNGDDCRSKLILDEGYRKEMCIRMKISDSDEED